MSFLAIGWLHGAAPRQFQWPKPQQRASLRGQCILRATVHHRSSRAVCTCHGRLSLLMPFRRSCKRRWLPKARRKQAPMSVPGKWTYQGGRPVRIPAPPPSRPPPKFSNPSFSILRFWGKGSAPKAPKIFFWPFLRGYIFFSPYVSILKILRILWRIQKCLKNTEKFLTPDLTSGSDLG